MEIIPTAPLVPGIRGASVYLLLDDPLTLVDIGMRDSEETIPRYGE
jgi:hypothetical protein